MAVNVKDAEEKLGEAVVVDLLEKDWKVVEPPTQEELEQEDHPSPKARNNPNSRKNLAQYNKRSKKAKEAAIKNLRYTEKEEDVNPEDIFGPGADLSVIEKILPAKDVLANRTEQEIYYNTIHLFLKDFGNDDLTFSDIDDIVTLAINNVLVYRLLQIGKKNAKLILDAGPTLEKFRKHSDKVKGNLASRRVDRIDVKNKPHISIVDLAARLDMDDELDFKRRVQELDHEDREYTPPKRDDDV